MSDYLVVQAINCSFIVLFVGFLVWRYEATIGRPATLRAYQYQFFALRDKAIHLVADGSFQEEDPKWQSLYRILNDSARAAGKARLSSGFVFVLALLKDLPIPDKNVFDEIERLPKPLQKLWFEFVANIMFICYHSSFLVRAAIKLATYSVFIKHWLERRKPEETRNYRRWRLFEIKLHSGMPNQLANC